MIQYLKIAGAPGEYFSCEPYRATMSVDSCAGMYREAKRAQEPRHPSCRGCAVGAAHAGDKAPRAGPSVYGSMLCSRCHEPGSRLLYGALCISCANRQLEVIRGRNAKGRYPIHARVTGAQVCRIIRGGAEVWYVFDRTTGLLESVFRVLHREPETVMFVRRRPALPASFLDGPLAHRPETVHAAR